MVSDRGRLARAQAALKRPRDGSDTAGVTLPLKRIRPPDVVPLTDMLAALSLALDLTEGQPMGHSLRTDLIALELAARLDLPLQTRRDLHYGALLKDAGCSSNASAVCELFGGDDIAAKRAHMATGWSDDPRVALYAFEQSAPGASWFERAKRVANLARLGPGAAARLVQLRCDRGADIVRQLGLGAGTADAVRSLDEHWDGHGHPRGLKGEQIPVTARVLGLAQILEVFSAEGGAEAGVALVRRRSGKWFDPTLVEGCRGLEPLLARWGAMTTRELGAEVSRAEPGHAAVLAGTATLDRKSTRLNSSHIQKSRMPSSA